MKKTIFLLIAIFIYSTNCLSAQEISSYGKDFWFAIPPNDHEKTDANTNVLKLYIVAVLKSTITVEYAGKQTNYIIDPNNTLEIDLDKEFSHPGNKYAQEVYNTGVINNKTFHISSDRDISISILNSKTYTGDSFIVFPVKAWGTNYVHLAYWDGEQINNRPKGSGMLIIANQDETELTIRYKGKPGTTTVDNKQVGDIEKVTLNKGQVFSFRSKGENIRKRDLSGTMISSNKPVGAISYHQRTPIPGDISVDGADHLVEMLPPVTAWGKKYVCLQLLRDDVISYF